ncbi:MAG: 4-hydroxy-tetrahydrodipicolinate synthase [Bowdeniella nasicola]|nr:4-hydroxy-tetrahydrodipicolinate synthase [Bowdeniella nasicola]
MSATFGTVIPAMVTPFTEEGGLDLELAQKVARHLVDLGSDGLLLSGTTGEAPTTHTQEKVDLIRAVAEAVEGRVPIMAGAGSNHTDHACRIAEKSVEAGADSLLVVTPYYSKPSQRGIAAHIRAVADAGGVPVMVYDIPGRTGVAVEREAEELLEGAGIVAYKDATGNVPAGIARARRTGTEAYSGDDALNLAFLSYGGAGFVSVVAHVAADRYRDMVEAVRCSDMERAAQIHADLEPLVDAIMGTGQGAVLAKTALHLQGVLPSASLRLPLVAATSEQVATLRRAMERLGYL